MVGREAGSVKQAGRERSEGSSPSLVAKKKHCGVEQLVARWAHNPKVGGSSPPPATKRCDSAIL